MCLQRRQRAQVLLFELAYPALGNPVQRNRIDEVQPLPPFARPRDEIRLLEDREVFGDRLTCHLQPLAQLPQRLAIPGVEPVQQRAAAAVGQGSKDRVVLHHRHTEPIGSISRSSIGNLLVPCQALRCR